MRPRPAAPVSYCRQAGSNPRPPPRVPGVAFSCQSQVGPATASRGKVFGRGLPPVSNSLRLQTGSHLPPPLVSITARPRLSDPDHAKMQPHPQPLQYQYWHRSRPLPTAITPDPAPFLTSSSTNLGTSHLGQPSGSEPTQSRRRPRLPRAGSQTAVRPRPVPGTSLSGSRSVRLRLVQPQAPPRRPDPALSARRSRQREGLCSSSLVLCAPVAAA